LTAGTCNAVVCAVGHAICCPWASTLIPLLAPCHPPCAMQLPLARVKQNYNLWYGGVPRLAIERPAMEVDETLDAEAATDAIRSTNIDQV
jgi:hypothetical protein